MTDCPSAPQPVAWQERQKLSLSDQWTNWYECQPFPRSAPRDFMIGLTPAQRRILQTEEQFQAALDAVRAEERERCAAMASRWGETHEPHLSVNARNAADKIARAIRAATPQEPT
jgi:hypothetical protein